MMRFSVSRSLFSCERETINHDSAHTAASSPSSRKLSTSRCRPTSKTRLVPAKGRKNRFFQVAAQVIAAGVQNHRFSHDDGIAREPRRFGFFHFD